MQYVMKEFQYIEIFITLLLAIGKGEACVCHLGAALGVTYVID